MQLEEKGRTVIEHLVDIENFGLNLILFENKHVNQKQDIPKLLKNMYLNCLLIFC
jgi:hypothetical protein